MKPTPHPPSPHLAFARARYQWSSPPAFDPRSPPLSRTYAQSAAYTPSHLPHTSRPPSSRVHPRYPTAYSSHSRHDRIHLRRTRRMHPVSPAAYISPYQSHTSRPTRPIHPAAYTPPALPLAFHFPSTYLPLPPSTYLPLPLHLPSASHLHLDIQRRRNYKAALWREVRRSRRRVCRTESTRGDERKGEGGG